MAPREVRQPEVAGLAALLLALVLVLPVAQAGHTALVAGAFLVELLSQGRYAPLSALTSAPAREALAVPGVAADRYVPAGPRARPPPLPPPRPAAPGHARPPPPEPRRPPAP